VVILHCQQNRCQTESRTRRKCRTSDMHGQALPLVYVNGHNASEIAVLMITSWHWDCHTVYQTHCYVIKANMLTNTSKIQYFWYCWLSILIMANVVRLKRWFLNSLNILWSWFRHSLLYASIFMVCTLHFCMHFFAFFTISKLISSLLKISAQILLMHCIKSC